MYINVIGFVGELCNVLQLYEWFLQLCNWICSYVIYDLSSEFYFLMSVNVSICYEFNNCFLLEVVVQDVMFFKFVCDFKSISFKMIGKQFFFSQIL